MAIVKTVKCANGGTVMIADDCFRGIAPEEQARRCREVERAIWMIDRKRQQGQAPQTPAG